MATELRQFTIGGKKVWVQVDPMDVAAAIQEATVPKVAKKAAKRAVGRFENTSADDEPRKSAQSAAARAVESADIAGTLGAVVGPVESALKALKPSEISIELKLGFKADAGVFIAKTSADASVTIKAVWKPTP